MSDDKYKQIFSQNLRYYMSLNNKEQIDLINDLGFNKSAVSTWCNGTRLPRMDKVNMLAEYFHINRSDLIEERSSASTDENGLTAKDNRDISKDVENIMAKLTSGEAGPASYNGEELDPEVAELFRDELEIALKRLKIINKEKYTPKKYKK